MQGFKYFFYLHRRYLLASFFIPLGIMALLYLTMGIFPGSSRSVLASDAFSQFSNFHASYRNALLGKQSFFYTWNASLGLNYWALTSYYLGGFFTPLVLLFPNQWMPDALYFLTLIKIGSAGLAFWFYAKHTFKIPAWHHVILAVCYALMSFATAHSELIMWLDALIYLPLVIWGIDRLLEKKKPTLLFVSYLLLFLSNYYMGFMIGIFSFLYFFFRVFAHWGTTKSQIFPYLGTSLLAGGASMVMILPMFLDLRSNGETLSEITKLKTAATGPLDFFVKNMIGVYDTTKYGSIPFIYAGLLPLVFVLLYFVSKHIHWKDKLVFLSLFVILIASFYLVPLNLFWHGMHAPNMFLFRYAFLLSFLVLMVAGYGWEQFRKEDHGQMLGLLLTVIVAFSLAYGFIQKETYTYLTIPSFILTIVFLIVYLLLFSFYQLKLFTLKRFSLFLLLFVSIEMVLNTHGMLQGILNDWNYASRSLYTEPYQPIKQLVQQTTKKKEPFYRLENLDPVSANDGLNYGYSGVGLFSSIRNRNSSGYLNELGFRSRGTNLNIRYPNNTLLMDSFLGLKYNISKTTLDKFGFTKIGKQGPYQLYENAYALPLAFTAPKEASNLEVIENDNLGNQQNLMNHLTGLEENFFEFQPLTVIDQQNTTIHTSGNQTTFTEVSPNLAKEITWEVHVPANSQAYLSLYPTNFGKLESSTVTVTVNGEERKTQVNINGQYYPLGYYEHATTFQFTASFYGTAEIAFQNPQVLTLDTLAYQRTMTTLQEQGANLTVGKRQVKGSVTVDEDRQLVTTIPYDKGWSAKVNGKKVAIEAFQGGFVSIPLAAGTNQIVLRFLPQGLRLGAILFIVCLSLFLYWQKLLPIRKKNK
ncbi:YfhO family protein [Enterococcus sp. LJL98]